MTPPPRFEIVVELEGLPQVRLHAETLEDERRLRQWLQLTACQRRLQDALKDALELLEAA
jgi:hypothetical protein